MRQGTTVKPNQHQALSALAEGKSVAEAAEASGVDPATVRRWLRDDFVFQAALNQEKRELQDAVRTRLMAVAERASEAVQDEIEKGNVKVALDVLKGMGFLNGKPCPIGPENPDALENRAMLSKLL